MEFMLDTADLAAIEYWNDHLELSGITTSAAVAGFTQDWQDLHPGKHVYDL